MLDLNVIREQIDGIDKQLVDLFEQRMKLTKEVAEYKIQTGKKVLDTQRERAKIEAVTKLVKNEANVHAIDDLFSQIMANSRKGQYQLLEAMGQTLREPYEAIESINKECVKIVYQGVPGAYTQEAACNFFGEDCDNYDVPTWRAATVPSESSHNGSLKYPAIHFPARFSNTHIIINTLIVYHLFFFIGFSPFSMLYYPLAVMFNPS